MEKTSKNEGATDGEEEEEYGEEENWQSSYKYSKTLSRNSSIFFKLTFSSIEFSN